MKTVAILQSNYIPWKGYFDLIRSVDEFIFFDDVQFTRRDWRNRNLIKTPNGLKWLTVPVEVSGRFTQKISETIISGNSWRNEHLKTLLLNYKKSSYFSEVYCLVEPIYLNTEVRNISFLNQAFIKAILKYLSIETQISDSTSFEVEVGRSERLASICQQAGATHYVSGPSAKKYIDEDIFRRRGVRVCWFDYGEYPQYPQLWGEFVHNVSILDLIFNCGNLAVDFMGYKKKAH